MRTDAEVTPIVSVCGIAVGSGRRGPITERIQVLLLRRGAWGGAPSTRSGCAAFVATEPLPGRASRPCPGRGCTPISGIAIWRLGVPYGSGARADTERLGNVGQFVIKRSGKGTPVRLRTSMGLLAGVELVRDRQNKASFDASLGAARRVWLAALAEGVIVRPPSGDVIALSPPFVITEKQIDRMVSVLDRAIAGVARELSS